MARVAAILALCFHSVGAVVVKHQVRSAFIDNNPSQEEWLLSGSQQVQSMKQFFFDLKEVQTSALEVCGPLEKDCMWKEADAMLCETLIKAGRVDQYGLSGLEDLEKSILEAKVDLKFAKRMVPYFKGEYRMRDGSTKFDMMMLKVKNQTTWNQSNFEDEIGFACPSTIYRNEAFFMDPITLNKPLCRKTARQYIVCQKLEEAVTQLVPRTNLTDIFTKTIPTLADASAILSTSESERLHKRPKELFEVAATITKEQWQQNGPPGVQELKSLFANSSVMKAKLREACVGDPHPDCEFMYTDSLYCNLLEKVPLTSETIDNLEKHINKNIPSDGTDGYRGVDWSFQSALIAKWRLNMRPLEECDEPTPTELMKSRVNSTESFKALMSPMCWDLYFHRPGCFQTAPQSLFCQAFSQALVTLYAPSKIFEMMEEQVPKVEEIDKGTGGETFLRTWSRKCP